MRVWLLQPIVDGIRRHVLAAEKIHGDDTPVPVLEPGLGRTRIGRLWAYVRDGRPFSGPARQVNLTMRANRLRTFLFEEKAAAYAGEIWTRVRLCGVFMVDLRGYLVVFTISGARYHLRRAEQLIA